MKRIALALLLSLASAHAADQVVATISVTNAAGTTNGNTIVINGSTRTWTNNVSSSPATLIQVTNSPSLVTTNLLTHFGTYSLGASATYGSSTSIVVRGNINAALVITTAGGWAVVTFTTNSFTNTFLVRIPNTTEPASNRITIASGLVSYLEIATNAATTNALYLTNYISASPVAQSMGNKTITNGVIDGARLTNIIGFNGTFYRGTNGYFTNITLDLPTSTNLVNYGNAISSPGSGTNSEQHGGLSIAAAINSQAYGKDVRIYGQNGLGYGAGIRIYGPDSIVVGNGPIVATNATNVILIGFDSISSNSFVVGLGHSQTITNNYVTIFGYGARSRKDNEVILGRASGADNVWIPGQLEVGGSITNSTHSGTNQWLGDLAYLMYSLTTLANGNNLAVPFTNVFVAVSGPSAAFTINGIYGGRTGREIWLLNRSGQTMTIANESGVDPTPANRITMSPASDAQYADGQLVHFLYDGTSSRWRASVPTASVTNSLASNSANFTIVTNDWVVNTYYTNVAQRAYVSATLILTATVTANAKVALYLDQDGDGTWEQTGIAAQTGLGLATADWFQLGAYLQPSARFMYTNLSTGAATASVNGGSSQWVKQ